MVAKPIKHAPMVIRIATLMPNFLKVLSICVSIAGLFGSGEESAADRALEQSAACALALDLFAAIPVLLMIVSFLTGSCALLV